MYKLLTLQNHPTIICITLSWVSNIAFSVYPSTTMKRKFIFMSDEVSWNDAAAYCASNYNGNLLRDSSEANKKMIQKYSSNQWNSEWGTDYWLGLYITDLNAPTYQWDGSCSVADVNLYHRFENFPSAGDLDSTKLCAVAKKDELTWRFEVCSIQYTSICQQVVGPCTYQRSSTSGECTTNVVSAAIITVSNREECEEHCTNIKANDVDNGECWAVTYLETAKKCVPSVHPDPTKFDTGTSGYKASCTINAVTNLGSDSLVSWKRCYTDPGSYTGNIPNSGNTGQTPVPVCSPTTIPSPTTTTTTTTTTAQPTTAQPTTTTTTAQPTTTTTTAQPITTTTTTQPTTTTTTAQPTTTTTAQPTTTTTTQPTTTTTTAQPTTTTLTAQPTTTTTTHPTATTSSPTTASSTTTMTTTTTTTTPPSTTTSSTTPATTTTTTNSSPLTSSTETTTASSSTTTTTGEITTSTTTQDLSSSTPTCRCGCVVVFNVTLEEKIQELKRELAVNRKQTSLYIRTLTSASDDRVSATGIGMALGAGVLACVFGTIILADVCNLYRKCKTLRYKNMTT